jgi:hypothetical protein
MCFALFAFAAFGTLALRPSVVRRRAENAALAVA